ncbi:aminotransferase class V-fold PLP-dependent enzyme [Mycoplasma leonicaptivi]|uniref:aminotransferase class V-fold PLP-dependent enzyme n=1 Tax=Mycoplasma leonicaptivi TaxID=36742 RepID=UPI000483E35D|nr:aminotransferase class V-fold PLP-dependent enzyme [Mycoplasma leonicaptivi]
MIDNKNIRDQFPILKNIVYFDSAALVLKPKEAIESINDYYLNKSISSRTADTPLGNEVNYVIKNVRSKVAKLLNGSDDEIIFTSGTTESINLFVNMFADLLQPNDIILLDSYNHSSNIIPWIEMSKNKKVKIIMSTNLIDDIKNYQNKIKLVSLSQETNNISNGISMKDIYNECKKNNILLFNDAAQAISHSEVLFDFSDIIVFSTNKFYGPTGMGVLAIKLNLLKRLRPKKFGGGSVDEIDVLGNWTPKKTIQLFEPGTPDLAGFFMFNKSLDFFNSIGYPKTQEILFDLSNYLYKKLSELNNIKIYSKPGDYIFLINVNGVNSQDVATYLGSKNIYTIAGIFCAHNIRNILNEHSFVRISLGIYNDYSDIDKLVEELKNGGDFYAF